MKKSLKYTLVRRDSSDVSRFGGHPIRLQFRGPRIDRGERVLVNGTLREVLDFARANHGEEVVQQIVDDAVGLQNPT